MLQYKPTNIFSDYNFISLIVVNRSTQFACQNLC